MPSGAMRFRNSDRYEWKNKFMSNSDEYTTGPAMQETIQRM